jgi:hypothetical protein
MKLIKQLTKKFHLSFPRQNGRFNYKLLQDVLQCHKQRHVNRDTSRFFVIIIARAVQSFITGANEA